MKFRYVALGAKISVYLIAALTAVLISGKILFPWFRTHDLFPLNELQVRTFFRHGGAFYLRFMFSVMLPFIFSAVSAYWIFRLTKRVLAVILTQRLGEQLPSGVKLKRMRRLLRYGVSGTAMLATALCVGSFATAWQRAGGSQPRACLIRCCSSCHSAMRPLCFMRSPKAWEYTVARMRSYAPDRISAADEAVIVRFLSVSRSWTDQELIEVKCQLCHDQSVFKQARTGEEWRWITERTHTANPFFLTSMQKDRVIELLTEHHSDTSRRIAPEQKTYEEACMKCHTPDIILRSETAADDWDAVLIRMLQKAPWLTDGATVLALKPWILQMRQNPAAFRSLMPHQNLLAYAEGSKLE